jgi:hypothetical protein
MKGILLAAIAAVTLMGTNANAIVTCELRACATTIAADPGKTGWKCDDQGMGDCTKAGICSGCACTVLAVGSYCTFPWNEIGQYIDGRRICSKTCTPPQPQVASEDSVERIGNDSLESAFAPSMTEVFYGYITTTSGTNNRSPTAGRAQSAHARLDVCMGANDVDAAIATNNATTCYNQYCGTSYNEHCNATGYNGGVSEAAAVCHDRCECSINGQTHSTCNQL